MADSREKALQDYRKKLLEHKEVDGRLKECTAIFLWFPKMRTKCFGFLLREEADVAV